MRKITLGLVFVATKVFPRAYKYGRDFYSVCGLVRYDPYLIYLEGIVVMYVDFLHFELHHLALG